MIVPFYKEQTTNYYTTRCVLCYENCHENCSLNETNSIGDKIFERCAAFITWSSNN